MRVVNMKIRIAGVDHMLAMESGRPVLDGKSIDHTYDDEAGEALDDLVRRIFRTGPKIDPRGDTYTTARIELEEALQYLREHEF